MKNKKNADEMIPFLAVVVAISIVVFVIQTVLDWLF